jgi:hypothetical protein
MGNARWLLPLFWFGCGGSPSGEDSGDKGANTTVQPRSGCDPLDPSVCALPYPSSYFEVEAETASGVQVAFGPESLPMNRDYVQLDPTTWNERDGASILTPVVTFLGDVSLDGVVGHANLEGYLADDVMTVLINTVTGERHPHFVELDQTVDAGQRLVILRPVEPLEYATRYVVGYRGFSLEDGSSVAPSEAFVALRDGTVGHLADVEDRRSRFDEVVFPALEGQGFARGEVQLAWDFMTISQEDSLGRVQFMRDDARSRWGESGPGYVIDSIEDADCKVEGEHIARTIYGTMTVPLYTDVDTAGAVLTRGEDGLPFYNGDGTSNFMVRIPCSVAENPGAMILQYGHGLLGSLDEARTSYLTEMIDEQEFVLIAQSWKGMSELDAGHITLMLAFDVSGFHTIPERSMQGLVEVVGGLDLIRGALAEDPAMQFAGRSVVDTERFGYYGNSQGAIMGGAYMGLSPTMERGVLGVGGMPYSLLLSRSADFDPFFLVFQEKYDDGREIALILALLQALWDPAESSGYAHAMNRTPLPGSPAKEVLLQVAIGDAQVTTLGAHVMARSFGAKLVAPATRPVWGLEEVEGPFTGSALVEWLYEDGPEEPGINIPPDAELDTHECPRREPEAQAQLATFLKEGTVVQTCDGICQSVRAGLCD